jgi:hypothetical protein
MSSIKSKSLFIALFISISVVLPQPGATAAGSSICNSVSCDNPQVGSVFDLPQDRQLNRNPAPVSICNVLNNWKVDAVIQVVAGILKVNWVYTLVPTVVCHLVG